MDGTLNEVRDHMLRMKTLAHNEFTDYHKIEPALPQDQQPRPEAPYRTGLDPDQMTALERRLTEELAEAQQQLDLAFQQRDAYLLELQRTRPVVQAARLMAHHPRSNEALSLLRRAIDQAQASPAASSPSEQGVSAPPEADQPSASEPAAP